MKKLLFLSLFIVFNLSCSKEKCPDCGPHGTCLKGECLCDDGWRGARCDEQYEPYYITVQSIVVDQFPPTDVGGAGWDLTSGPDVYIRIKQNGVEIYNTRNNFRQNAAPGTFWDTSALSIFNVSSVFEIELWDYDDFDADDYMGGVIFPLYFDTNGFPNVISSGCPFCSVNFTFSGVTYHF